MRTLMVRLVASAQRHASCRDSVISNSAGRCSCYKPLPLPSRPFPKQKPSWLGQNFGFLVVGKAGNNLVMLRKIYVFFGLCHIDLRFDSPHSQHPNAHFWTLHCEKITVKNCPPFNGAPQIILIGNCRS